MTLHSKIKSNKTRKSEEGVTLLLAIMILAAITAIVFSIATISLNEIRTSSELTKTEPVITADGALAEDQLFRTVRGLGTVASCTSPSITTVNSVKVTSCAGYYLDNPYAVSLAASAEKDFYLYNPVTQGGNPGYTSVGVQLTSGVSGTVYLCTFDVANCVSNPNVDSRTLSSAGTTSWTSPALDPATQYQLIIVNGAGGTATFSVTSSPTGLPAGVTTIDNSGTSNGVTRKIEVTVPQ
ncbi:hypothetical protein KGQ24_03730 [Patescibacteria group bacterium]|nr:hypothetical protein [Patescibacteria group bacterium]